MEFTVHTSKKEEFVDITSRVEEFVKKSGVRNGLCVVYCPHTTAAITVNENADPSVVRDILASLNDIVKDIDFSHVEGNSPAHVKSSLFGCSKTFIVERGELKLGTWQGVYFCEFDGPRERKVYVKVV
ncbi:MAG: YjbQ family protein [Candidatus Altiarchaeales archaeon]|nr:YjbQ family protein [Candidatus Altiarchaeales archaeon]